MHRLWFAIVGTPALLLAQSGASYHITHTYPLGGDGSWDYVVPDPASHRLYIARQNRVMVVDEDKGTVIGEVSAINGAHGTAIAATTGHGFATAGNDKAVIMFDLKTFQQLAKIPAAEDADAIVYDAPSNRVFTLNGDAHSSTVIDAKGTLVTNIDLGGKPEYGVSAGGWQGVRESDGHQRSGGDRCKERESNAALADGSLQGACLHGHRYGGSSVV